MNILSKHPLLLYLAVLFTLFSGCETDPPSQSKDNDEVTIRLRSDPAGLNLFLARTGYTSEVAENIFFPLMVFDPTSLQLTPCLVKEAPLVTPIEEGPFQGGHRFTYEILKEAKWSNGSPVLASDYAFTFKIIMNPEVPTANYRAYYSYLRDIEIDSENPRKFTVITDRPYILALYALSNISVYPEFQYDPEGLMKDIPIAQFCQEDKAEQLQTHMPRLKAFAEQFKSEKYAFDPTHISGAGPYAVEEIVQDQRIVLKRKANWWGEALSKQRPVLSAGPERLIYKPIPDETVAISLMKNQAIDAMGSILPREFTESKNHPDLSSHYNFYTPNSMMSSFVAINNQSPYLRDKRVRRALAHILDIDAFIENGLSGMAERIVGPVHPSKTYYHTGLAPIAFDLEEAQRLLKAAGWSDSNQDGIVDKIIDGKRVEMKLRYRNSVSSATGTEIGIILKENAQKAGIAIELINQEFKSMIKAYSQRDYELLFSARIRDPMPDDFKQSWHTSSDSPSGSNRIGFGNATSDALIEKIQVTTEPEAQKALYLQFQELVYEEQPCIFLFAIKERIAIHKRFEAVTSTARPGFFPRYFKKSTKEKG